jgi:hypothetical protein
MEVIMVGKNPEDLLEKNYLILNLNDPCEITDISWIKPGKVLREVTLTTAGAKAAIDFTSSHNMQYAFSVRCSFFTGMTRQLRPLKKMMVSGELQTINVPTVWDETKFLHAKIGEYGVIARKKGDEWFIGGINGDQTRTLDLNFAFLDPDKEYSAKIYSDDPSVNTRTHVRIDSLVVDSKTVCPASLNANNGIAMHIKPVN